MKNLLERHNQKLTSKNIPFVAFGPYITGVANPAQDYRCTDGHEFRADRARMVAGKIKCPDCGHKNIALTHKGYENRLLNEEIDFIPIEQYRGSHVPILHECINGHQTRKTPHAVLERSGCSTCSGLTKLTQEDYIKRLAEAGGEYTVVGQYVSQMTKIKHQCQTCFHVWEVRPHDIKNGSGCPDCARMGFSTARPATLYYIRIWDQYHTYYKIGITNKSIAHRMKNVKKNYKVLLEKQYETGREALAAEQMILEEYKDEKIYAPQFLPNGGYTELFKSDILLLDVDLNRLI